MEPLGLVGTVSLVFLLTLGASYAMVCLKHRARARRIPLPNLPVRLRGPSGMYRCHFLREDPVGWWFSAPLSRDAYVPLRIGEKLFVEAPVSGEGAVVFESEIVARDGREHEICLRRPSASRVFERRLASRDRSLAGRRCSVNGQPAEIVDISEHGVRVICLDSHSRGDEVRVGLPDRGMVFGWVLEATPEAFGSSRGTCLRIRLSS